MSNRGRPEEAFTEFATAATPWLLRRAVLLCGDRQLAEDLVQTSLTKLYVAWPRVESPYAYARTTLLRTYTAHRKRRSSSEVPVEHTDDRPSTTAQPGDRLVIADALRVLKPTDRAVVVLRYYEQSSVAETAAELGLTQVSVRKRAARALARLRLELTGSLEESS